MAKRQRPRTTSRSKFGTAVQARQDRTWLWLTLGAVAVVLLVGGLFYLGYWQQAAANTSIEGVKIFPDPGAGHQPGDLTYSQQVPVGGPHNPEWLNCGAYAEPVRRENAIHSMEHGAVWIAYQPELPADQVEILRNLVKDERAKRGEALIVLAPFPGLDDPIVLTAWRVQLRLDNASDERVRAFVERYQRGPYYPEPGAECTFGGVGEPIPQ